MTSRGCDSTAHRRKHSKDLLPVLSRSVEQRGVVSGPDAAPRACGISLLLSHLPKHAEWLTRSKPEGNKLTSGASVLGVIY